MFDVGGYVKVKDVKFFILKFGGFGSDIREGYIDFLRMVICGLVYFVIGVFAFLGFRFFFEGRE